MKLTNKDKNYLSSIGYRADDFDVIERNSKHIKCDLITRNTDRNVEFRITQKQAIKLLGRETFLSGLGRATFHDTAFRTIEDIPNITILFY
jgi:hypothetical protein